jgi:hypothetical protein
MCLTNLHICLACFERNVKERKSDERECEEMEHFSRLEHQRKSKERLNQGRAHVFFSYLLNCEESSTFVCVSIFVLLSMWIVWKQLFCCCKESKLCFSYPILCAWKSISVEGESEICEYELGFIHQDHHRCLPKHRNGNSVIFWTTCPVYGWIPIEVF